MSDEGAPLIPKLRKSGTTRTLERRGTKQFGTSVSAPATMTGIRIHRQATGMQRDSIQASCLLFLQDERNVRDNYPKLNPDQVARAAEMLAKKLGIKVDPVPSDDEDFFNDDDDEAPMGGTRSMRSGSMRMETPRDETIDLEEAFNGVMMFKRRPVQSATLLHFAIWVCAEFGAEASIVGNLLDNLQNPDDAFIPAVYAAGSRVVLVSAVHIAAGLGQVEVLKMLTRHAQHKVSTSMHMTPENFVSQWAYKCPAGTSPADLHLPEKRSKFQNFYQPIHDSTFGGNAEVTIYLLKQRADPCTRNIDNITPLHFVAFVGLSGGLEEQVGDDLKKIVHLLQRTGKAVGAKADMTNFLPGARNVTPLEVAVEDASRFPQDYLGLLAPCLAADTAQLTYFDDIKRIADVTAEGALRLVRNISEKGRENQNVLRRFRVNAQMEGKSDVLASILYTAPLAASEMLELLEVNPEVEDASHHPIPAKTSLWGFFQNVNMRCTYQPDVTKKETLFTPFWEWKTKRSESKGKDSKMEEHKDADWHNSFVPMPRRHARSTHIKNVQVVSSLLPNILDIDVFMAYSHCQHEHLAIMNQKTVQGSISCLWGNLIETAWTTEVFFRFLDTWAYVAMSGMVRKGEHVNSLAWPIIASGNLYSLAMIGTHLFSMIRKWALNEDDESMHDMWSPSSRWNLSYTIGYLIQTLIGTVLVVDLQMKDSAEGVRDKFDDALLALCLLISCFRFIWMWRLSVVGSRIYTIVQTFCAAAVNQMLFITFMLLFSFIVALQVLSRLHSWRLALDSYRGFLFGDGDGFSGLGMDVDQDYGFSFESNGTLVAFAVLGAFFFNVVVLNIIIAIYGHEYDRVESDTPLLFMKGRADYCVKSLLSCYLIQWRGPEFNRGLIVAALVMLIAGVHMVKAAQNVWVSAVLMAAGQVLLHMALVQCDWFSPEGQGSDDKDRFLWICHPHDWQWTSDDSNQEFQQEMAEKQDALDARLESVDEKLLDLADKLDMLLGKKPGAPEASEASVASVTRRSSIG